MAYRWTKDDLAQLKRKTQIGSSVTPDQGGSRPRKYRNQPVELHGEKFDSKKEATVYQQLRIRETLGEITALTRQVEFPLLAFNRDTRIGEVIAYYRADFQYTEDGKQIVVDCKGGNATKTAVYKLKKAILAVQDGIEIVEV